jgi:hypothetical protein
MAVWPNVEQVLNSVQVTYNFFERFGGYYGGTLNEFRVRVNYRPTSKFSIGFRDLGLTFTSLIQLDTSNTQASVPMSA